MAKKIVVGCLVSISMLLFGVNCVAFGWFESFINFFNIEYNTAKIQLTIDENYDDANIKIVDFGPNAMPFQYPLETALAKTFQENVTDDLKQYNLNTVFLEVWQDSFYKAKGSLMYNRYDLITPGCLVFKSCTFVNDSNVPVYFRISKPTMEIINYPDLKLNFASLAWLMDSEKREYVWEFDAEKDVLLLDGGPGDDYFYLSTPIDPGKEFTVMFVNSIFGYANNNSVQSKLVNFSIADAELIQATNNSVYLEDSWRRVSLDGKVKFIPYTEFIIK